MDSVKSFKGYGKVDEIEQQVFRRKIRRHIRLLVLSTLTCILIIAAVVDILIPKSNLKSQKTAMVIPPPELPPSTSLCTVCSVTQHPDSCFSRISTYNTDNTIDPKQLFNLFLQAAAREVARFAVYVNQTVEIGRSDGRLMEAMEVCSSVVDDAEDRFNEIVSVINVKKLLSESTIDDVRTWLNTVVTNLETCLDSLREMNSTKIDRFVKKMEKSTEFASNSLAIVTNIIQIL